MRRAYYPVLLPSCPGGFCLAHGQEVPSCCRHWCTSLNAGLKESSKKCCNSRQASQCVEHRHRMSFGAQDKLVQGQGGVIRKQPGRSWQQLDSAEVKMLQAQIAKVQEEVFQGFLRRVCNTTTLHDNLANVVRPCSRPHYIKPVGECFTMPQCTTCRDCFPHGSEDSSTC